jgi:S-disulfanyl-L-cysteine oxidoreductase SoxD
VRKDRNVLPSQQEGIVTERPESLSNDDVYAVSAYILNLNGLIPADATLDAKTLSAIGMPNRKMFVDDPRPDVKNPACRTDCLRKQAHK